MEKTFFVLEGTVDQAMTDRFKRFLKDLNHKALEIVIFINSTGGNVYYSRLIEAYIDNMQKKSHCTFIMLGLKFDSAAFNIFLRGNKRLITPNSTASFHLPVPNKEGVIINNLEEWYQIYIRYITQRTELTSDLILRFNNHPLSTDFMIKTKIATETVESFDCYKPL